MSDLKPQFREFLPDVRDFSLYGLVVIGLWNGSDPATFRGKYESVELSCMPQMPTSQEMLDALMAAKDKLLAEIDAQPGEVQLEIMQMLSEEAIRDRYSGEYA